MEDVQDKLINILTLWLVGVMVLLIIEIFITDPLKAIVNFSVPLAIGIVIYLISRAIIRRHNN